MSFPTFLAHVLPSSSTTTWSSSWWVSFVNRRGSWAFHGSNVFVDVQPPPFGEDSPCFTHIISSQGLKLNHPNFLFCPTNLTCLRSFDDKMIPISEFTLMFQCHALLRPGDWRICLFAFISFKRPRKPFLVYCRCRMSTREFVYDQPP